MDRAPSSHQRPGRDESFGPIGDVAELAGDGKQVYLNIDEPLAALTPDPSAIEVAFTPFSRVMAEIDAYARTSAPILVNQNGPLYAVSMHRNGNAVSSESFGRIYLTGQAVRSPKVVFETSATFLLFDHHLQYDRSLGVADVDSPSDRGGQLTLLDGLSTGKPKALAQWHLPGYQKPGFKPKVEFARIIDNHRAVVQVNQSIYGWELDSGKNWLVIDNIPATGKVAMSPTGRYLAIGLSGGAQVVDVDRAELLGKVPFKASMTPSVAFSPGGNRLAMTAGNEVAIWNLQNAGVELSRTIEQTTGRLVGWVGDEYLLTQFSLVDLETGNMVWKYNLPSGMKEMTSPDGYLAFGRLRNQATLVALPLPHAGVEAVKRRLKNVSPDMLLVGPGTAVSLEVRGLTGSDEAEMKSALQIAVEKAGWTVKPRADTQVMAEITRGDKQKLNFRQIGGHPRDYDTVTMKPYRASIEITQNGKVIWERSKQNMVPFIVRMEAGESLKSAVRKFEKIDPAYFERVTLPPRIFKPEIENLIGRSRVQNGRWTDF